MNSHKPTTAYLIDGLAYVFRSFFAMPPMAAPNGTPINAVFGLGMTLQKLLNEHQPELVACCFDAGAKTFRNELFPDYKANRSAPPEDLIPQFDLCQQLVAHMGIATAVAPGYEADDLLATLTRRLRAAGHEVVIVTGDKDLAQLLAPGIRIFNLAKDAWWTAENTPARMGVRADQVGDYLALTGDSADNIPGVRGVGPKAAVALLAAFENLAEIYADLERVETLPVRGAKGLRTKLEAGRESALLSQRLVALEYEAPCELVTTDMRYEGAESGALDSFAEQWGLGRIAAKVPRL